MRTSRRSQLLTLMILLLALSGCGQKGPLYQPDTEEVEEDQESALPQRANVA